MLKHLMSAIAQSDGRAVQKAIFELGQIRDPNDIIPDEVAFSLIDVLKQPTIQTSSVAGHLLNFFEFESRHISALAKHRCNAFLKEWGNNFNTVHGMQVVGELRVGHYLNP